MDQLGSDNTNKTRLPVYQVHRYTHAGDEGGESDEIGKRLVGEGTKL